MNIKNIVPTFGLFCLLFFIFNISAASAAVTCQPIYGGGQSCVQAGNVQIVKTVAKPDPNTGLPTDVFIDNVTINDPKYRGESPVNFRLAVTNVGHAQIATIEVKDVFPQFINFTAGPGNLSGNTLTFQVQNLQVNETRTFSLSGKVVSSGELPGNQGTVCPINQAVATDVANPNQPSQDNAQVCIQKFAPVVTVSGKGEIAQPSAQPVTKGGVKVFPPPKVVTTPPTGPEALSLLALIPSALTGFYLRRKSGR